MRVLIAEDDCTYRDILSVTVRAAGHEPVPFIDGAETWHALTLELEAEAPIALLTDLALPGAWCGTALARAAGQRGVPVAVVTSRPELAAVTVDNPDATIIPKNDDAPSAVIAWLASIRRQK